MGPSVTVRIRELSREVHPAGLPPLAPLAPEGRAPASKLASLAYIISQVQLCESLKPDGNGISRPEKCVDIYRLDDPPSAQALGAAQIVDDARYVDFLDANSPLPLAEPQRVAALPGKTYTYGVVRWVGPARITAEIPLDDGSATLSTQAGSRDAGSLMTHSEGLTALPAAAALTTHAIQESWFRLYVPIDLRAANTAVDPEAPIVIDLALDVDGLVGGTRLPAPPASITDAAGHSIMLPALMVNAFPAVPARPVRVETYILRQSALPAAPFDLRFSLYVRDDAPQSPLSVDLRSSRVTGAPANPAAERVAFLDTAEDGSLTLLNYALMPVVSGLQRGREVGDVSRALLPCNGFLSALTAAGCSHGEAAVDVELADITLLAP